LADFPIQAHANGVGNPCAMYRKSIKKEAYPQAELICDPLNLLDIAPVADGAAALLLCRHELLPGKSSFPAVRITASAQASDTLSLHDRQDMLFFEAAQRSTSLALQKAGRSRDEVDFFEYHDSFSIFAALSLEAAGFAARGEGWKAAREGRFAMDGELPCATLGGLKARGNPGGATGVYQAVEAALQLRGLAGRNQVHNARCGMIQSLGGPASTAVTHILERLEA